MFWLVQLPQMLLAQQEEDSPRNTQRILAREAAPFHEAPYSIAPVQADVPLYQSQLCLQEAQQAVLRL